MTNFTLSDFYNPVIISITKVFMDLAFVLQIFMLPFISYVIIKNQNMKIYRWYLINEIAWNFIFGLIFALCSPVQIGVYPIILLNSFFEDWLDINSWFTIFEFYIYTLVNTAAALAISVAYRVVHLLNLSQLMSVVDKPRFLVGVIGIVQVMALGLTYLAFETRRSSVLGQESYEFIATNAPFLEEIFIKRRALAFVGNDADMTVFIILYFSIQLNAIVDAIFLTIFPIIFLKRTKKNRSAQTYELQLKLYKSCLVQIWIIMALDSLPACFIAFIYWIKMSNSAIFAQILLTMSSWHGPVNMFVIGYFIPSHRKFFVELLHRILNKIKHSVGNNAALIHPHTAWSMT